MAERLIRAIAEGAPEPWRTLARLALETEAQGSGRVSRAKRDAVLARDGLVCRICGLEVAPDDVHIDHRLSTYRGGSDDVENLQVAHSRCNLRKGPRPS